MVRQTSERVLLIGDSQHELQSAISQAMPHAQITSVSTVFDGIGELSVNAYTTILAAAEPIERRPEPAVRMLRQLAGDGKLVLFGHPTLEILSRKMLQFGCDDYIITPASGAELQQLFAPRALRLVEPDPIQVDVDVLKAHSEPLPPTAEPAVVPQPEPIAELAAEPAMEPSVETVAETSAETEQPSTPSCGTDPLFPDLEELPDIDATTDVFSPAADAEIKVAQGDISDANTADTPAAEKASLETMPTDEITIESIADAVPQEVEAVADTPAEVPVPAMDIVAAAAPEMVARKEAKAAIVFDSPAASAPRVVAGKFTAAPPSAPAADISPDPFIEAEIPEVPSPTFETLAVPEHVAPGAVVPPAPPTALPELPFADIFLDALLESPEDAPRAAVRLLNDRLKPHVELRYAVRDEPVEVPVGGHAFSHPVQAGEDVVAILHLLTFSNDNDESVQGILAQLAHLVGKLASLRDRHHRLQKLSITDDLTGLYNARYFRHFLGRLVERAQNERFNVTLLLFDIDDFKKYNDQYGHVTGDEILRQTAKLMRRCCREHDLVARIGGDEFAVVFWDKEGPRQSLDPNRPRQISRAPQTPVQMFERFKRLAASSDFAGLGESGRGRLSVSGGLAVYPYDARDVPSLIKAADDYLMFKAKKAGKNSVYLVEGNENGSPH